MKLLRDPLVQFLAIGALLLIAQTLFTPPARNTEAGSLRIEMPTTQTADLERSFREVHGRAPNADEARELQQRWVDDEVLVREALALGLEKSDPIVRRELQQKLRFLLEDTTPVAEPSEADLQSWLAGHEQQYGHAASVNFDQVFISRAQPDGRSAAQAMQAVDVPLAQHPDAFAALGDHMPGGSSWRAQTDMDLRRNFGEAFAQTIATMPIGSWSQPIASGLGLHRVRITARTPFRAATLDEVHHDVAVDCRQARRVAANRRALDALRSHYVIVEATQASR
jgi:hypothetical protein